MSTDALPLPDPALLPDDPAVLKQLVVQLLGRVAEGQRASGAARAPHQPAAEKDLRQHQREARSAARHVVRCPGRRGRDCPEHACCRAPRFQEPRPHGRGRIPDEIEREERVHDLTDAEKAALGGMANLVELPPERSEQLDWRPSTLFVIVHVRKKYARKEQLPESGLTLAEQNVVVARKPPEAIPWRRWPHRGSWRR